MKRLRTKPCGLSSRQHSCKQIPHTTMKRGGLTLMEVLMSLLVMGVGVTTVATLFPISIMRSIQGTQLTNSALLRYNATAMIDLDLDLIFDPNKDGNSIEHYSQLYVVDPLGYFKVRNATDPLIIDPTTLSIKDKFGNGGTYSLNRYTGFVAQVFPDQVTQDTAQAAATNLVVHPDSWVVQYEDVPLAQSATSVTLANINAGTVNSTSFPSSTNPNDPPSRVVLTDTTGKKNITRDITDTTVGAPSLVWTDEDSNSNNVLDGGEDGNGNGLLDRGIPAGFTIGKVQVETRELRYTWLLTVKNNSSAGIEESALVNVVVFFRRAFAPFDEHVFSAGNGTDNIVRLSSSEYRVTYDASDPEKIPFINKGGYLFDVEHGRWYRIQRVVKENSASQVITLEESPPNGEVIQHAMFPRGIVDVYPIGSKRRKL